MASALRDVEFFEQVERALRTHAQRVGHLCTQKPMRWPCQGCKIDRLADEAAERALEAARRVAA